MSQHFDFWLSTLSSDPGFAPPIDTLCIKSFTVRLRRHMVGDDPPNLAASSTRRGDTCRGSLVAKCRGYPHPAPSARS